MKVIPMELKELTDEILSAAHEVHWGVGPGLHRAEYEECLCYELSKRRLSFERNKPIPMQQKYKDQILNCGYAIDLVVENAMETWMILRFLKFNVADLQDGIVRIENRQKE